MVLVLALAGWHAGLGAAWGPWAITTAMVVLAVVSFVDDLRSLGTLLRFGCHAGAALVALVVVGSQWSESAGLDAGNVGVPYVWMALPLAFLWVAGYTNAFNFMDGINGLAGGQAMITGIGMAAVAVLGGADPNHWAVFLSMAVAGVAAGFLPHNFPRARMFMGDVGSAPIGYLLAALALALGEATQWRAIIPLVLIHSNFVLDTGITLMRRVMRREAWYKPHREHFYQLLIRSGRRHSFVTVLEMALQIGCLGLLLLWSEAAWIGKVGILCCIPAVWFGFFLFAERQFRRAGEPGPRDLHQRDVV